MGAEEVLKRKSGVIYGDDVYNLFKYAQEHKFAIPAVNVTSSSTVVAALEAARNKKSPIILQMSYGGAAFFCGKGISNKDHKASVEGAIAGAHYIRSIAPVYGIPVILHTDHCAKNLLPWLNGMIEEDEKYYDAHEEPLFSSHMVDFSEEPVKWNKDTTEYYMKKVKKWKQFIEMEIGITGGEEDGVKSERADKLSMYTLPEDIHGIYEKLSVVSRYFTIAAGFGNVHGVYQPGNVSLDTDLLRQHQLYVKEHENLEDDKPVFLVFHGGSGSEVKEYQDAISYGVVKVNLDTDLQWAYLEGIRDYVLENRDYLMKQVGNPDGEHKPNKGYYDPRKWVREGEITMRERVEKAIEDFTIKDKKDDPSSDKKDDPSSDKEDDPSSA